MPIICPSCQGKHRWLAATGTMVDVGGPDPKAGAPAVDSAVFLWLAFGSLDFIAGQIVGKMWASVLALPLIALLRRRVQDA